MAIRPSAFFAWSPPITKPAVEQETLAQAHGLWPPGAGGTSSPGRRPSLPFQAFNRSRLLEAC